MRPRTWVLLCCIALAGCSDDPAGTTNRVAAAKAESGSGPLISRNPGADPGGVVLLLEAPNALSRISAQGFADIWAAKLDRSGFRSYEILHIPPRRLEVRFWGVRDPVTARNALRSAYGNPIDLRLIQERVLP
jgi:hypothetical protein